MEGGALIKKNGIEYDKYDEKKEDEHFGAKILATGSSSCIFRPNIPCKGDKKEGTDDKISKIVYGAKSDRYLKQEKKLNGIIQTIKGYGKWALIYDNFCKAPAYNNIFKYEKDIIKCMDEYYEDKFNETNNMMIGTYGGETFEDYFVGYILKNKSSKTIDKHMYILFKKMEPLFIGLKQLYNNEIVHLDIKVNNIVIHEGKFKYIDFGLSSKLSDKDHFEKRSSSEFDGRRIYLWYPMEYIYSYTTTGEKYKELLQININDKFRKHYDKGIKMQKIFEVDFKKHIKELLNDDDKINHKELNSMIDTYSLGLLLPFLFVDYNRIKYIKSSKFLKDLFDFLGKMCEVDYKKRIKPVECLKQYYILMKKYSSLEKGSSKLKKSKKKSKSRRRK